MGLILRSILVDPNMSTVSTNSSKSKDVFVRLSGCLIASLPFVVLSDGNSSEIEQGSRVVVVKPCSHPWNCWSRARGGHRVKIIA
jgi:hypothetical protein